MAEPADAEVMALVERIRPILAGKPPEMQSAVLADLLAIWIAGHVVPGDAPATQAMRAHLLAQHLAAVADLVTINAHLLGTVPEA